MANTKNKREYTVSVSFFNGTIKTYGGVQYHKYYGDTLRLIRHPKSSYDIFLPLKNVESLNYVNDQNG